MIGITVKEQGVSEFFAHLRTRILKSFLQWCWPTQMSEQNPGGCARLQHLDWPLIASHTHTHTRWFTEQVEAGVTRVWHGDWWVFVWLMFSKPLLPGYNWAVFERVCVQKRDYAIYVHSILQLRFVFQIRCLGILYMFISTFWHIQCWW